MLLPTTQPKQAKTDSGTSGVWRYKASFVCNYFYGIMHTPINLNLKLKFCSKTSFSLLLILLDTRVKRLSDDAGSGEGDLIVNKTFAEKNGRLAIPENNKVGNFYKCSC